MDAKREAAFRSTRYRVRIPLADLLLRVDQPEPRVARLLRELGADCAVLVTAYNPGARRATPFRNRRAQRRLWNELTHCGYRLFEGCNEDPHRRWPEEPSMLVIDLPLAAAQGLCARYGQVAFLWLQTDGIPRLRPTTAVKRCRR